MSAVHGKILGKDAAGEIRQRMAVLRQLRETDARRADESRQFDAAVRAELERRRLKSRRAVFTGIALTVLSVPAVFILADIFSNRDAAERQWASTISALVALSTTLAAVIVSFLSQRVGVLEPLLRLFEGLAQLARRLMMPRKIEKVEAPKGELVSRKDLKALQAQIDGLKLAKRAVDDAIEKQLVEDFKVELQRAAAESLLTDLADEQRQRHAAQSLNSSVSGAFTEVRQRLEDELALLRRSAVVNLTGGSVLTSFALLLLGIFVFGDVKLPSAGGALTTHILARVGLVLALEAFALFFLRLYKQCLAEIKHYHNELTNMEMRSLGTLLAIQDGMTDAQQQASSALLSTERNFVLKKGETTTEIEKHRIDAGFDQLALKEGAAAVRNAAAAVRA